MEYIFDILIFGVQKTGELKRQDKFNLSINAHNESCGTYKTSNMDHAQMSRTYEGTWLLITTKSEIHICIYHL